MSTVRKFLFDNDFDAANPLVARNAARKSSREAEAAQEPPPPPPPPPSPPEPIFSEAELNAAVAAAKDKAMKDGLAKGKADAQAQIEAAIASTLSGIGKQVSEFTARFAQDRETLLSEAAGLALAMTRKLLPELNRRGGLTEIEATIERCLIDQRREPRLTVRVPADLLPALLAKIDDLAAAKHFDGKIQLVADPSLKHADCRIEWADGGLERNGEAIWRHVSAALDRCLATQGIEPAEFGEIATAEQEPEMGEDGTGTADAG